MNCNRSERFSSIVSKVESKTGYKFSAHEVFGVLLHTIRKCKINKKSANYVPILFENELRDYAARLAINIAGYANYLNKKKEQEVTSNVRDLQTIHMSGWVS